MKPKSTSIKAHVVTLAGLLTLTTACQKDAAYDHLLDSDGIDLTVQVAKGLTLPIGSTDTIFITEVLDPESIEQLHLDNDGNYTLSEEGDFDGSNTKVDDATATIDTQFYPEYYSLHVVQDSIPDYVKQHLQVGSDLSMFPNISIVAQREDITFDRSTLFDFASKEVDAALLELKSATLKEPVTVHLTVNISELPEKQKTLEMSAVKLTMPKFIIIEGEAEPGVVIFEPQSWVKTTSTFIEWTESLTIIGVDFGRDPEGTLKVVDGKFDRNSVVLNYSGCATLSGMSFSGSELLVIEEDGEKKIGLKHPITPLFSPSLNNPEIKLASVEGKFNPNIDPIDEEFNIDLGEDADFLTDERTRLELSNPVITARIKSNATVKLLADITLDADNGQRVAFNGISLYNQDYTADSEGFISINLDASKVSEGDIHKLLSPIPSNVKIQVKPYVDKENFYTLNLGEDISVEGSYLFTAPLEFDNISFVYDKKSEDVLGENRDDVTDSFNQLNNAVLQFTVENTIPTDLTFNVVATNYQTGKEDAGVLSAKFSDAIKAGTLQNKQLTTLSTEVNINDLSKLGDLIFRIEGTGSGAFNAKEYIKISNASLTLKNGVNVDLNSK